MDKVSELHRPIEFTIDGRSYTTTDHRQTAAALLRLAGLDPSRFDLGELKGRRPYTWCAVLWDEYEMRSSNWTSHGRRLTAPTETT